MQKLFLVYYYWQKKKEDYPRPEIQQRLNHISLIFADDSLIFAKASIESCKHLKAILECYALASGQFFNYDKSSMFFSGKIPGRQVEAIRDIFQLKVVSRHEKYLGIPSMIGRKKIEFFHEIKLKV